MSRTANKKMQTTTNKERVDSPGWSGLQTIKRSPAEIDLRLADIGRDRVQFAAKKLN